MSWFSLPRIFTSGSQVSNPPMPNQSFAMIDRSLDHSLQQAIASYLPREKEKFKAALANRFNLTCTSELGAGDRTKVWLTNWAKQDRSIATMALRMNQVEQFREPERSSLFVLDPNRSLFGAEWHIFLQGLSHLPRPQTAIAWNHTTENFEVLTREQITDHHANRTRLTNSYTLYATLTPYTAEQTPLYIHSMPQQKTQKALASYVPKNLHKKNLLFFALATTLKDLEIVRPLGEGSFSQVWEVTFQGIDGLEKRMALKIAKTDAIQQRLVRENYFQISQKRFGGEFAAFLPDSPYILSSHYAIVWDQDKETFRLIDKERINQYHKDLRSIGTNTLTLYGTLSACHQKALTLKELMETKAPLDISTIRNYAHQLLLALAEFPEGMIHRDLKPANILVTREGLLKILDFGLSKVDAIGLEQTVVGTMNYIPPEVYQQKRYDQKADLYSLFSILFEMATGQVPIVAKSRAEFAAKMEQKIKEKYDPAKDKRLKEHTQAFRNFLSHLGNLDPKKRWSRKQILQREPFLQQRTTLPTPPSLVRGLVPSHSTPNLSSLIAKVSPHIPSTPSFPSLRGRIAKLLFIGGAAFVLYHLARRAFIWWSQPRWKTFRRTA